MKPNWQKLASLAHEICTLWFQFFVAVFASKGYPFKTYAEYDGQEQTVLQGKCLFTEIEHVILSVSLYTTQYEHLIIKE